MERRQLLRFCGAGLAGLSGCTFSAKHDSTATANQETDRLTGTDEPPTTTVDEGTATGTNPGTDLAIGFDALQPAVVEIDVDFLKLVFGGQFLYLKVSVETGPTPALQDLAFRFDGDSFAPIPPSELSAYRALIDADQYEPAKGDAAGWVLFELPERGDASDAALVWPGGAWRPGEDLRTRLGATLPTLTLEEWHVPDAVPNRSRPRFQFTVRNEGAHIGRFIGGINAIALDGVHYPDRRVSRQIPPGQRQTWDVTGRSVGGSDIPSEVIGDESPDIEYELISPSGNRTHEVRLIEEEQSSETTEGELAWVSDSTSIG